MEQKVKVLAEGPASWRACWVTQPPLGFGLQLARWTRRLPSSMKVRWTIEK
jgi:hypothetical protein